VTTPNVYDQLDPPAAAAPAAASTAVTPGDLADANRGVDNVYAVLDPPKPTEGEALMDPATWKRNAALLGRNIISGVAGVPMLAADAGVATRNILGDIGARINTPSGPLVEPSPDYPMPSTMFQDALTQAGMPVPSNAGEKVASFVESGLTSGALPGGGVPKIGAPAPSNFVSPAAQKAQMTGQLIQRAQDAGMVVPPSTTNPTVFNRTLESVAGKESTQNFARINNDAARTRLASQALGLNPDAPLTPGAIQAVKAQAGQAYDVGRSIPQFATDSQYLNDMVGVLKEHAGANESFPGAASPDLEKLVDTYLQPTMTGNAGISAVKLLRDKASDAFSNGNSEMGRAYKGISQAIENQLERAAQNPANGVPPNTISALRQARQLYAKASLVGDSMAPDGTVLGPKLAAAWRADEPISGPLRDAAEFAAQYPKANLSAAASGSPVHHLSTWGALLGAGLGEQAGHQLGHPGIGTMLGVAALPVARSAARSYLLGPGQGRAIPALNPSGWRPSPQAIAAGLATTAGQ
jgi:hypothetical protein